MHNIGMGQVRATLVAIGLIGSACVSAAAAVSIQGQAQSGGSALANSTVTLLGRKCGGAQAIGSNTDGQ